MSTSYPHFSPLRKPLPRDQLRQLQEVRLLATVARTWDKSPLFQQRWTAAGVHPSDIRSIEDFERLAPSFDKDDIRRFSDGEKVHFLPLSDTDIERTSWFYLRILATFSLPYRSVALVISKFEDAALVIPLERTLVSDGFIPCNAEATGFDAARTESFLRRLNPPLVFGLNTAVIAGLEALGYSPEAILAGRIVWVRDEEAYRRLAG